MSDDLHKELAELAKRRISSVHSTDELKDLAGILLGKSDDPEKLEEVAGHIQGIANDLWSALNQQMPAKLMRDQLQKLSKSIQTTKRLLEALDAEHMKDARVALLKAASVRSADDEDFPYWQFLIPKDFPKSLGPERIDIARDFLLEFGRWIEMAAASDQIKPQPGRPAREEAQAAQDTLAAVGMQFRGRRPTRIYDAYEEGEGGEFVELAQRLIVPIYKRLKLMPPSVEHYARRAISRAAQTAAGPMEKTRPQNS